MHDTDIEQYYELLETYSDEYYNYAGAKKKKKKKMDRKYKPKKLYLKAHDYGV